MVRSSRLRSLLSSTLPLRLPMLIEGGTIRSLDRKRAPGVSSGYKADEPESRNRTARWIIDNHPCSERSCPIIHA
ncbi:hypothetical protein BD779DRAFT_1519801 [Infundibulicybe gibba]|nr:hypothetical protein BD779DRAFT_1519801 [Infundibulicybe gibba]